MRDALVRVGDGHDVGQLTVLPSLLTFIRTTNYCANCSPRSYQAGKCCSTFRCSDSGRYHHTLLPLNVHAGVIVLQSRKMAISNTSSLANKFRSQVIKLYKHSKNRYSKPPFKTIHITLLANSLAMNSPKLFLESSIRSIRCLSSKL
uniref:Uncharacterized protein n=1 Tax=Glossina morsitans morsitans TaxID=37546 RepID=A0A1B0FRA8_GLOMM